MAERSGGTEKGLCVKCSQTADEPAACPRCEGRSTGENSRTQREDTCGVQDTDAEKQVPANQPEPEGSDMTLQNEPLEEDWTELMAVEKRGGSQADTRVQVDNANLGEDEHGPCKPDKNLPVAPTLGQGHQGSAGPVVLQGENLFMAVPAS